MSSPVRFAGLCDAADGLCDAGLCDEDRLCDAAEAALPEGKPALHDAASPLRRRHFGIMQAAGRATLRARA